jgi:putative phage-type endonuclease
VTMTNSPRKAREAKAKLRGDLPTGEGSKLAEAMGYDVGPIPTKPLEGETRGGWLQERRTGVGSADIPVVMGWGFKDQSEWKLWAQKVGLISAGDDEVNEWFEFGHRAEPMIAQWFQDKTGLYVGNAQQFRRHPEHDWMVCTIDGEVFDHPNTESVRVGVGDDETWTFPEPLGGLEIKTTGDPPGIWEGAIPDRYAAQGQWQMAVCGWERMWFAVLHGRRFRVWGPLERDERDIALLMERAGKFWTEHVIPGVPPEIDESEATGSALNEAYRGVEGQTIDLPELASTIDGLRILKLNVKRDEAAIQLAENRIKAAMGPATEATFGREKVELTWRAFDRTSVDNERLRNEHPSVYALVKKSKPIRAFRIVPDKEETE